MESSSMLARPEVVWFFIGLIFLISEFFLPGLIILFFGIGAWITSLVCLFSSEIGLNIQLLVFVVVSVGMLVFLRKYLNRLFYKKQTGTHDDLLDDFVGKTATVDAEIKPNVPGKVSFRGTQWSAQSDDSIEPGQVVEIVGKESIVLNVKKIQPNDTDPS